MQWYNFDRNRLFSNSNKVDVLKPILFFAKSIIIIKFETIVT